MSNSGVRSYGIEAEFQHPAGRIRNRRQVLWVVLALVAVIAGVVAVYNFRMLQASVLVAHRPRLVRAYEKIFGQPVAVSEFSISGIHGPVAIRLFKPLRTKNPPPMLMVHGLVNTGNEHPYLNEIATHLARMGFLVALPTVPAETRFEMHASDLGTIADTIHWLALYSNQRVTLFGNSFSAGLVIPAAAEPSVAGEVKLIFCNSGYYDMDRIGHYFLRDPVYDPNGKPYVGNPPTPLRIAVPYLSDMVPAEDLENVRAAVQAFNEYDDFDPPPGNPAMAHLTPRQMEEFKHLKNADTPEVRSLYRKILIDHRAEIAAISPSSVLKNLRIPMYILHGPDDPIFPEGEVEWMRKDTAGHPDVHILVSPWMSHVTVGLRTSWWQKYRLVTFCEDMLKDAAQRQPLHN